jgi:hypothetical protein
MAMERTLPMACKHGLPVYKCRQCFEAAYAKGALPGASAQNETSEAAGAYALVLSFSGLYPTMPEEHAFVHGVQFGELWHRMSRGDEAEIEATTHEANREVIARAAAAKGWELEVKPSGTPTWDFTTLRKVKTARPNPHGLRAVN